MPDAFDLALEKVFQVLESGIGRNIGRHEYNLAAELVVPMVWATSRRQAERSQASTSFDNWLLELDPQPASPLSSADRRHQSQCLVDLATQTREAIEDAVAQVVVPDFSMADVGFSPPTVISTFSWVAISFVQNEVMAQDFGWLRSQVSDFWRVYEAGYLPVGCINRPGGPQLLVW